MEGLKQPVEFHLIALSCSFSRFSKAVTIVTDVNDVISSTECKPDIVPGFGRSAF